MLANHRISGHFPPRLTLITLANTPRYLSTLEWGRSQLIEVVAAHLGSRGRHAEADVHDVHVAPQPQIGTRVYVGKCDKEKKKTKETSASLEE